jgi:hypothetical protein
METLTIGNQRFMREMAALQAPVFLFTSDVVNVGEQIEGNLAFPANYDGWSITFSTSDDQTPKTSTVINGLATFDFSAVMPRPCRWLVLSAYL